MNIHPAHLTAAVERLCAPADREAARAALDAIRDTGWDVTWLRLAVLHLAGGRVDLIAQWVDTANGDPRDVKVATQRFLDPMWDGRYRWPP